MRTVLPSSRKRGGSTKWASNTSHPPPATRTLLTGAMFDLTRNNLVTPDLNNPLLSIQSGQARSRGAEIEARTSLTDHIDLVAAYTYLDTVYTRDNSGLQGKRLAAIPQQDGVASYDLDRKLPRLTGAALYLNARNLLDEKYVASCCYGNWCAYGYGGK